MNDINRMFVFVSSSYHLKLSYAGTTTSLEIVLNTPKNPYLNQSTPKNTYQIFPAQKNPGVETFRPPKNLILVTWNLEYPARPLDLPQGKFCYWPDISRKAGKRATTFANRTSKIRKKKPWDEFRQSEQLFTQKFMENCHIEMPVTWLQKIVQIIWKGKFSTRLQSWCWI